MFHLVKHRGRRVNLGRLGDKDPSLRSEKQNPHHYRESAGTRNIAQKISNNNNNKK